MDRSQFLRRSALGALWLGSGAHLSAHAQAYPAKPVRVVVLREARIVAQ